MYREDLAKSTAQYRRPRVSLFLISIETPYTVCFFYCGAQHRSCHSMSRQMQASYAINPLFSVAEKDRSFEFLITKTTKASFLREVAPCFLVRNRMSIVPRRCR